MLDVDEDENSSTMLVALWESPEGAADDMLDEREKVEEVEEEDAMVGVVGRGVGL